jgi:UDP-N-acetylmuramoyl-L-alanyl-D-glutamate--2,6-diaminopimelate ligase
MADKTLAALSSEVAGDVVGDPGIAVTDMTHDSRQAAAGVLFVAIRGEHHDGHEHVAQAVESGAPAVCVESPVDVEVSQLVVEDTRVAMGPLAAAVHDHPSRKVPVVAVTGTNGKTTVTHYIEAIANGAGEKAGLIGTVATRVGAISMASSRTTPEATDFQRLLARMRDHGADLITAEVSSHALELRRVSGTEFAVAAFTNLSQDHLDFHGSMAAYRASKERLFRDYPVNRAVINVDDAVGRDIARWTGSPVTTVGVEADIRAENLSTTIEGSAFDLVTPTTKTPVVTPIIGWFNVQNALLAVGCCLALGISDHDVASGIQDMPGVPGRFELVPGPIPVVVDYAHTPSAVSAAIATARAICRGRVLVVVGAGGERDRDKRPKMGKAASQADLVILTSDNPRSEDPMAIVDELALGADADSVMIELDRRSAIASALEMATGDDLVLVLGKGHETGQEAGGVVLPFDDRLVVAELLGTTGESDNIGGRSRTMSP